VPPSSRFCRDPASSADSILGIPVTRTRAARRIDTRALGGFARALNRSPLLFEKCSFEYLKDVQLTGRREQRVSAYMINF
jgi:hypothetical protein